jgi:alpha-1,6-mannosyltransferase
MGTLAGFGLALEACFAGMLHLGDLRQQTVPFLVLYGTAFVFYGLAVWWLVRQAERRMTLALIWGPALVFRLTLLLTTPTLSDDVWRFIWDGRLANAGISPYALPANAPRLDAFDSPQRALINNNWMASPYLPLAQALFVVVYRFAPDSAQAFQVAATTLDLLTAIVLTDLLRRLRLPATRVLIYLWNPLVVVEFAHGAHVVDALMICLMMAALWALVAAATEPQWAVVTARSRLISAVALAGATLTKGLPALLLPVVGRRWGWRNFVVCAGLIAVASIALALGAGWGLLGPLDGTGLFGAIRIYAAYWNYNGGLYHWLEVALSGYPTPGAVPPEIVGWGPIQAAKIISLGALSLVLAGVWHRGLRVQDNLAMLRLALVPLTAYLLLATTVHPWYVALIAPLLPFLAPRKGEATKTGRFLVPGIYFCAIVALSYLTYLDPAKPREYDAVRLLEYVPLYLMLIWAAWPATGAVGKSGID